MHYQLCYSAKEGEILATECTSTRPKSRLAIALLLLVATACAPPSPRPHEILARLAAGEDASASELVLRDGETPLGVSALLAHAAIGAPRVDRDAATVEVRIAQSAWLALDAARRAAWARRIDPLPGAAEAEIALRFHFVREANRWKLDLRAYPLAP